MLDRKQPSFRLVFRQPCLIHLAAKSFGLWEIFSPRKLLTQASEVCLYINAEIFGVEKKYLWRFRQCCRNLVRQAAFSIFNSLPTESVKVSQDFIKLAAIIFFRWNYITLSFLPVYMLVKSVYFLSKVSIKAKTRCGKFLRLIYYSTQK